MNDTAPTARRQRDKALSAELTRVFRAYPFARDNLALERVARRLAILTIGLKELRAQVKQEKGCGHANPKLVVELRQYAAACGECEAQLTRVQLQPLDPSRNALADMTRARNAILERGAARMIEAKVTEPAAPARTAFAMLRDLREQDEQDA